jgi:hypothetical protein
MKMDKNKIRYYFFQTLGLLICVFVALVFYYSSKTAHSPVLDHSIVPEDKRDVIYKIKRIPMENVSIKHSTKKSVNPPKKKLKR